MSNTVNDSVAGETELEAVAVCSTMVGGGGGVCKTEEEELEESHSLQSSHFFQPTESGKAARVEFFLLSLIRVTTYTHLNKS